ncbi:maleylpyruvate isomerase family mycothiol-dependent enzyme [Dactylosporangium sp. CA-092794]|uniref:maleylpyruvate isomerase family mycothiol-dependent enzyme n=1 Tax=Dactylosporangium sp. CA-092794 TaxID=3239929 RepID=UPI003D8A67E7
MTGRTPAGALRWMSDGTATFRKAVAEVEDRLDAAGPLPGWTRRHIVAHVAANADALGNLVHWARTGEPRPMYASASARAEDIERGSRLATPELVAWLTRSSEALEAGMRRLRDEHWQTPVVTATARTVPAAHIPWLRAREVWVHAVDLAADVGFADLPTDFLTALCTDVVAQRANAPGPALVLRASDTGDRWELAGHGTPVTADGPCAQIAAYLTGRAHALTTAGGGPAPALPAWL